MVTYTPLWLLQIWIYSVVVMSVDANGVEESSWPGVQFFLNTLFDKYK